MARKARGIASVKGVGSTGDTCIYQLKFAEMVWLSRSDRMGPSPAAKQVRKKHQKKRPHPPNPCDCASAPVKSVRMGPANFDAAMTDWAATQRQWLRSGGRSRLQAVFARGIDMTSHYSGTGAAELSVAAIAAGVSQEWNSESGVFAGVKFHGCCDLSPICRQVLMSHSAESKSEHCFGDMCSRPPESVVNQLRKLLLKHQRKANDAPSARRQTDIGKEWVSSAMEVLKSWEPQRSDTAQCYCHGRACPLFPPRTSRYHLEVSGINCQPWSAAGKRLGWLDDRSIPCLILVRSILGVEPDGVCIECTPEFDFPTLANLLQAKYDGDFVLTSPEDHGMPVARRRKYMWFDRRASVAEMHVKVCDLLMHTRRVPRIGPEDYLRAPLAELQQHYNKLLEVAIRAGKLVEPSVPQRRRRTKGPRFSHLRLRDVLYGGYLGRYEVYRKNLQESLAKRGCHLVDIAKSPGYSSAPTSSRFPTLLKSSCLVAMYDSAESDRLVLPSELPAVHGLHIPPIVAADLPPRAVRALVGNSMHVAQVGCFVQFALAGRTLSSQEE